MQVNPEGSGHSVTSSGVGPFLLLDLDGLLQTCPGGWLPPHDCPVHRAEKLFALSFSEDLCSSSFPCFLKKPERMLHSVSKQVCVL